VYKIIIFAEQDGNGYLLNLDVSAITHKKLRNAIVRTFRNKRLEREKETEKNNHSTQQNNSNNNKSNNINNDIHLKNKVNKT
jgi:hypothetical protein